MKLCSKSSLTTLSAALRVSFILLLSLFVPPANAASDPFAAGSARLSVAFGGATAFDRDYSVFGLGFGYFVADGIEAGLDAETWFGNSPHIEQVSPQVRVVVNRASAIRPYIGAYYRRTHIEGYRDFDTIGGRAGAFFLAGRNAYFGAGLALDSHLNCDRTVYASCTEIYPELLFAVVF
jgi:hypothetical protein